MYERFNAIQGYSEEAQERLENSTVAVVGLGATGSVIAENLARHGVKLVLIGRDYLEEKDVYSSNIYTPEDCDNSVPKAEAAAKYLEKFTAVAHHVESLNPGNVSLLDVDLVMDGTDNLETRFLVSEYARKNDIPWIYTAAVGEKGYSMLFHEKCFNCLFDQIDAGRLDTCETAGIMREVAGIAAMKSSRKAVKLLAGKNVEEKLELVSGTELDVEGSSCEVCRREAYPHLDSDDFTVAVCGENKYQVRKEIDGNAFERLKSAGEVLADNEHLVRVDIDGREFTLFRSGRAILEAEDRGHAEARFSEVLGI